MKATKTTPAGQTFVVVVIEQVTQRVWYEISDVDSVEAAIAAYKEGDGSEGRRRHLSTDFAHIEDVYQEEPHALSLDHP